MRMLYLIIASAISLVALVLAGVAELRRRLPRRTKGSVGFFHPYANGGGGGERVLWCAVQALQTKYPDQQVILYCGEQLSAEQYAALALQHFNIYVQPRFQVVAPGSTRLLEPDAYPTFTLLGQAWGSVRLAWRTLHAARPQVWVDTAGWAFIYPLARLAGCSVAAYVHYPMVSSDMTARVARRSAAFNNAAGVADSLPRTAAKLAYYQALMLAYGLVGRCAQVAMANSSWTRAHVRRLWGGPVALVYPPVDTASLQKLPLERGGQAPFLVSVAQFRPEKAHLLQLQALARARRQAASRPGPGSQAVLAASLKLVGSCRNEGDRARVQQLRQAAEEMGIAQHVEFCLGASNAELQRLLGGAVGGLHTMTDEHFGISVVEYMAAASAGEPVDGLHVMLDEHFGIRVVEYIAAGVVPIAHDSAGPSMDIVTPSCAKDAARGVGFLCTSEQQYADAITQLLTMPQEQRLEIAARARRRARDFSDARFMAEFVESLQPLLGKCRLL